MKTAIAAVVLATATTFATSGPIYACACCTHIGERTVTVRPIDASHNIDIRDIRFSKQAELFLGEMTADVVKGISGLTSDSGLFEIVVHKLPDRWVFEFRDKEGHSGSLTLMLPNFVSIFEVDPREEMLKRGEGPGPRLYKEWKLTGKAMGTGIFMSGMQPNQKISLILQGHGMGCATSGDFTHWTLEVFGPKAAYSFIGTLAPAK
jgi:hypothetical protein